MSDQRSTPEEVAQRLRHSLGRLVRTLRRHDEDDLSPTVASILFAVGREGPLTAGDIARRERLAKPSVTAAIEKLAAAGLVERRADDSDGRVVWVAITAAGRRRIDARRARPDRVAHDQAGQARPRRRRNPFACGRHPRPGRRVGPRSAIRGTKRALRTTFAFAPRAQLPAVLHRAADLPGRQLAHARSRRRCSCCSSPTAASRSACSPAAQFGPVLLLGAWAGLVADRSDKRTAAADRCRRSRWCSRSRSPRWPSWATRRCWSFYAVAFAGGITLAFDNPARRAFVVEMVPETQRAERGQPQQRPDDQLPHRRARARRPAVRHRRLRLVLHGRRPLLHRGARRLSMMRTDRAAPAARRRARARARCARACATCARVPDLWIPLVMMAVIGTLTFNFQVVLAAVRRPHARRHRRDLHGCSSPS